MASHPEARELFRKIFSRPLGFALSIGDEEESLTFTSHHRLASKRLTPGSLRNHLDGLGVSQDLIKTAVEIYEERSKKPLPKLDELQFDKWFRSLPRDIAGEKLKAILASTPESFAKWDRRFKQPDRSWELPGEAVIDITNILLLKVLDQAEKRSTTSRRYYRWKKKDRIPYSVTVKTFTFGWNISSEP